MSIENNLERIANALEALVASKAGANVEAPTATEVKAKQKAAAAEVNTKMTPPVAPEAPKQNDTAPEAPQAPAAPAGLEVNSPEECNKLLVDEYNRLGATPEVMQRILGVMENNFKVRSVNDLSKEQYGPLITAVREIK